MKEIKIFKKREAYAKRNNVLNNFTQKLIHTMKRHITSYHLQRMVQNDTTWKEMRFCEKSESIY